MSFVEEVNDVQENLGRRKANGNKEAVLLRMSTTI
jgi:hypothetical protein